MAAKNAESAKNPFSASDGEKVAQPDEVCLGKSAEGRGEVLFEPLMHADWRCLSRRSQTKAECPSAESAAR